ncbi:metallophosphatase domain-containing protein [Myxococcota bacterium]|nr:metallophosphatase domain-containing protein [Myxococcota bacterium]
MRLVLMSDTHRRHPDIPEIPEGDILIHAGDFTGRGHSKEIKKFSRWMAAQPHPYKIIVAGNHDFLFETEPERAVGLLNGCIYLCDSGIEINGLKIWGSPIQPWFLDWAFNVREDEARARTWAQIPDDTDVLITHTPPYGIMDANEAGEPCGCRPLRARVAQLGLALHVFGHIHEGYGVTQIDDTLFANAAICDVRYQPTNAPIVIDLEPRRTNQQGDNTP